jgi:hypothetical protein
MNPLRESYKITETKNFEVAINILGSYGYFEHHIHGEEVGGGLWFEDEVDNNGAGYKKLVDYDGTFELPLEVANELKNNRGVKVEDAFFPEVVS